MEERVLSIYPKDMTTGNIETHIQDIYGVSVSEPTKSKLRNSILPSHRQNTKKQYNFALLDPRHLPWIFYCAPGLAVMMYYGAEDSNRKRPHPVQHRKSIQSNKTSCTYATFLIDCSYLRIFLFSTEFCYFLKSFTLFPIDFYFFLFTRTLR